MEKSDVLAVARAISAAAAHNARLSLRPNKVSDDRAREAANRLAILSRALRDAGSCSQLTSSQIRSWVQTFSEAGGICRQAQTAAKELISRSKSEPRATDNPFGIRNIQRQLRILAGEVGLDNILYAGGGLSVITGPIVICGIDLGKMIIRVEVPRVFNELYIGVQALTPVRPIDRHVPGPVTTRMDACFFHPHVDSYGSLCCGNSGVLILSRFRAGQLAAGFLMILDVLQTFNGRSCYVQLAQYHQDFSLSWSSCRSCYSIKIEDRFCSCNRSRWR